MGRGAKIESEEELENKWEEYKIYCDNQEVTVHRYHEEEDSYKAYKVNKRIIYNIKGFCAFIGISSTSFYNSYTEKYKELTEYIKTECEADARRKFETGEVSSKLAPLWMYNYTSKENDTSPISFTGESELE